MQTTTIQERTLSFSLLIINFIHTLPRDVTGLVICKQLTRCGTSIGANIAEAQDAASRADFIKSMTIALKEARETEYWLKLVELLKMNNNENFKFVLAETQEIIKILRASLKKLKGIS